MEETHSNNFWSLKEEEIIKVEVDSLEVQSGHFWNAHYWVSEELSCCVEKSTLKISFLGIRKTMLFVLVLHHILSDVWTG